MTKSLYHLLSMSICLLQTFGIQVATIIK